MKPDQVRIVVCEKPNFDQVTYTFDTIEEALAWLSARAEEISQDHMRPDA